MLALSEALGVAQTRNAELSSDVDSLAASLGDRNTELDAAQNLIASLTATRDQQAADLEQAAGRISDFEQRVAALIRAGGTLARGTVEDLDCGAR